MFTLKLSASVVIVVGGVAIVVVDGPPQLVLQLAGQGHDVVHGGHQYVGLVNTEISTKIKSRLNHNSK